jgi:hypothetical protein
MLIGDYVYVNAEKDNELIKYANWISALGFFAAPIGLFVVNFVALKQKEIIKRTAITALIAFVLSGFWFLLAFTVIGNFHFAIGGKL